jgi:hypothetical protein
VQNAFATAQLKKSSRTIVLPVVSSLNPFLEVTTKLRNLVLESHQLIDSTFSSGAVELITLDGY